MAHLKWSAALYVAHMALAPHVLLPQSHAQSRQGEEAKVEPAAAGGKSKGKRKAVAVAAAAAAGSANGSEGDLASELTSAHGEAAVMARLDALVLRSKELCAAASDDEVVQRVLEVRRQCAKCGKTPENAAKGAASASASASAAASSGAGAASSGGAASSMGVSTASVDAADATGPAAEVVAGEGDALADGTSGGAECHF